MLCNLKNELLKKGLTYRDVSNLLGVSEKAVWDKINEKSEFKYSEAQKIQRFLFPQFTFEYLFNPNKPA